MPNAGGAGAGDVLHEPGQHVQQAADAGGVCGRHRGLHQIRDRHAAQPFHRGGHLACAEDVWHNIAVLRTADTTTSAVESIHAGTAGLAHI